MVVGNHTTAVNPAFRCYLEALVTHAALKGPTVLCEYVGHYVASSTLLLCGHFR